MGMVPGMGPGVTQLVVSTCKMRDLLELKCGETNTITLNQDETKVLPLEFSFNKDGK